MSFHRPARDCDAVRDELGELALGTLSGRRRSQALEHVAACATCRDELASLAAAADAMLLLAPTSEPPVGFELRLMERLDGPTPRRHHAVRRRGVVLVAAAALLIAAGFAVGDTLGARSVPAKTASATGPLSANLTYEGHALGHAWITPGEPSWVYMTLDDARWSGTAWCRVTLRNGQVLDVGVFSLTRGYGAWAAKFNTDGSSVKNAEVTNDRGYVIATATFST